MPLIENAPLREGVSQLIGGSAASNWPISSGKRDTTVSHIRCGIQLKYPCVSWFRIPTIWDHGMPGNRDLVSSETLRAASPTISIAFTRDNRSIRSFDRSSSVLPLANPSASRAASSMWRRRTSSRSFILNSRRSDNLIAEVPAQFFRLAQIHFSAQQLCQLQFHACESKAIGRFAGLELDQYIDIARRPKPLRQHRAKQRQPADVMPLAKRGNLHARNGNRQRRRHSKSFSQYPIGSVPYASKPQRTTGEL